MEKVVLPDMKRGVWEIKNTVVDRMDYHSFLRGRGVPLGESFAVLTRDGSLVMSDTPAEMWDHRLPVIRAFGSCLINGLGIGMVLKNVLLKPDVKDVTVVEISQDLIDMVSPHYADPRVEFVCADAFEYRIPKGKRYQMVWHDIWDNICEDNLPEMIKLHRKYGRHSDWQGSWSRDLVERLRAESKRQERLWGHFR